jgi:hypothetical protein
LKLVIVTPSAPDRTRLVHIASYVAPFRRGLTRGSPDPRRAS